VDEVWIGFLGYADDGEAARRFEDEVLTVLSRHGAEVRFRGHRRAGESVEAPNELHVLWFPSDAAFDAFLADPVRRDIVERHGEVFRSKVVARYDPMTPEP
jgi:hypothetical protein